MYSLGAVSVSPYRQLIPVTKDGDLVIRGLLLS